MIRNMFLHVTSPRGSDATLTVIVAFDVLFVIAALALGLIEVITPDTTAVLIAAGLGFGAWAMSALQARISMRKQHTFNVLLETRLSDAFNHYRYMIFEKYPGRDKIDVDEVVKHENVELRYAVRFMANYYEFISSAMELGDLDENLLKEVIRGNLCSYYEKCDDYIEWVRKHSGSRRPKSIFKNFETLYRKWSA